jgi:putative DNA primase/helicase
MSPRGVYKRTAPAIEAAQNAPHISTSCPEAEVALLAALLIDWSRARAASDLVSVDDFEAEGHRAIYRAVQQLREEGEPIGLVTVADIMRKDGSYEQFGKLLVSVVQSSATVEGAESHARSVRKHSIARRLVASMTILIQGGHGAAPDDLMREASARVRALEIEAEAIDHSEPEIWTFEDIEPELDEISWLWPNWLPQGFLAMLVGTDGVGKSKFAMRMAQSVLLKYPWPDGAPWNPQAMLGVSQEVMFIDTEGSQRINMSRIRELNLPSNKIYWFKDPRTEEKLAEVAFDDPLAWSRFEKTLKHRRPALVILDALRGLVSGDENSSRDMARLKVLASVSRDVRCVMLMLHHIGKPRPDFPGGEVNMDRIRGSTAIRQFCRSIIAIDEPDPTSDRKRVHVLKLNVGEKPNPLGMDHDGPARVQFTPVVPTAPHKETVVDQVCELLLNLLERGPMPQSEVREQVEAAGFSWPSATKARQRLGIIARPEGNVDGKRGVKRWLWSLKARTEPDGRWTRGGPGED